MDNLKGYSIHALRALSLPFLRRIPIETWPGAAGRLHGISAPRSALAGDKTRILFALLEQTKSLEGDVAECGVYRGASLIPMALYLRHHGVRKVVLGFDSFEGFDASVEADVRMGGVGSPVKAVGGFGDTSLREVEGRIAGFGLSSAVMLVKGRFAASLPSYGGYRFSFVHLDCDLYDSYRLCLDFFFPRLNSGGIILLDEYNDPRWPGCNRAVDEFLGDKPGLLSGIQAGQCRRWYIRKR